MSKVSLQLVMVAVFVTAAVFGAIFVSAPNQVSAVAFCPCCGMYCKGPTTPCGGPGPGCTFVPCPTCTDLNCTGQCLPGPGIPTQCDVTPGSCSGQPEKGSPKGAKEAMDMAKKLLDALKKKKSSGGAGAGFNATTTQPFTDAQAGFGLADFVTSAGTQITNVAADIFSSVFGGGGGTVVEEEGPAAGELLEKTAGGDESGQGATKAPSRLIVGGLRTVVSRRDAETSGDTFEEDIGAAINILGGLFNIDSQRQRSADRNAFFSRLCVARPWQASFVTRIFSASFFDSLCIRQGYSSGAGLAGSRTFQTIFSEDPGRASIICPSEVPIGIPATIQWGCAGSQSSGDGFDTQGRSSGSATIRPTDDATYTISCANGGRASCFIEVGKPRVQLVAYPERVPLGARTKLFWTSEGVVECTLEGPGLKERGIRGAATTPAILNEVTYTILCVSEDDHEARSSVIVGVGD